MLTSTTILPGVTYHPNFVSDPDETEQEIMEQTELTQRSATMGERGTPRR